MKTTDKLKSKHRNILKKELRNMEYQMEQFLMESDQLYYSLQADIPEWGVFKAHLEAIGLPESSPLTLEYLLECAAGYLKNPKEHLRPTDPVEYLQVACMYVDSINTIEEYIKDQKSYKHFSSMEDLFPGWDEMIKAYRAAIHELLKRSDAVFATLWEAGCASLEQMQYWAEHFTESAEID